MSKNWSSRTKIEKMSPNEERMPVMVHKILENENEGSNKKNGRLATTDDFLTADESYCGSKAEHVSRIRWLDLIAQIFIHGGSVYGIYLVFTEANLLTALWGKYYNVLAHLLDVQMSIPKILYHMNINFFYRAGIFRLLEDWNRAIKNNAKYSGE